MSDRADRLAEIAAQLAGRVRDDDAPTFQAWLSEQMQQLDLDHRDGWAGLAIVLACAVPVEIPFAELTAWRWAGHKAPVAMRPSSGRRTEVDPMSVSRALSGDAPAVMTTAERTVVIRELTRRGLSARRIGLQLGVSYRTVQRHRSGEVKSGLAAPAA